MTRSAQEIFLVSKILGKDLLFENALPLSFPHSALGRRAGRRRAAVASETRENFRLLQVNLA